MPNRPLRPCKHIGCSELVESGYCATHAADSRLQDRWRGSAHSRGYGRQHRKVREQTMQRDKYLCVRCLSMGRVMPAIDSHHVKKLKTHPELGLDPENRVSLCKPCHEEAEKESI